MRLIVFGIIFWCVCFGLLLFGATCVYISFILDEGLIAKQGYCKVKCISSIPHGCDSGLGAYACWAVTYRFSLDNITSDIILNKYGGHDRYQCQGETYEYCFLDRSGNITQKPPSGYITILMISAIFILVCMAGCGTYMAKIIAKIWIAYDERQRSI